MTDIWTALAPQLAHLSPTHPREALALADTHRAELAPPLVALQDAGRGLIDDVARETALWPAFHELPPVQLPPIPLGSLREPIRRDETKVGRNDPCPCGSGRKYKKCHGAN